MSSHGFDAPSPGPGLPVPEPIRELLGRLAAEGHRAYLVGGCVRDLLRGDDVADFDVTGSARAEQVIALFPRAVPIGLRHGTVMVPTRAGPVDVTELRAGPRLEDDLAHRDFTLNALAWDPRTEQVLDPFGGAADLRAGCLRAVRSAEARMREDPLRALRAARLVAQLGLRPDASVEQAMASVKDGLAAVARERIQREIAALLVSAAAGNGLALLRRTGIEALLAPGVAPDATGVVDAMPRDLTLRLAAWLRGTEATQILTRLRFARRRIERVARLVSLHPVESAVDPANPASVRRLMRRARRKDLEALFALREAELCVSGHATPSASRARCRLEILRRTIERVRRAGVVALRRRDLALGGRDVMRILGCGPSPRVGAAFRYLTERVLDDPACNTPERLRTLLEDWPGEAPPDGPLRSPVQDG